MNQTEAFHFTCCLKTLVYVFMCLIINKTEKTFQSKPPDKERLIFELSKKEMTFIKEKKDRNIFYNFGLCSLNQF